MNAKHDGGPAFPMPASEHSQGGHFEQYGMSLRDWLAGQAITGIAAGYWGNPQMGGLSPAALANAAYQQADAMIVERAKVEGGQ